MLKALVFISGSIQERLSGYSQVFCLQFGAACENHKVLPGQ